MTTKITTTAGENAFLKMVLKTFSHMEMYKLIDGKVEKEPSAIIMAIIHNLLYILPFLSSIKIFAMILKKINSFVAISKCIFTNE